MDSTPAAQAPPSAHALANTAPATHLHPSTAPVSDAGSQPLPSLVPVAFSAATASAAGLYAAAISCSHYVLSTLILHSPSTIDSAVVFRHVAGTAASLPAAHALVHRRYAALHLFLAWSCMQVGRLLRRKRIAKLPPGTQLLPPPWSLLLRTSVVAWSSLELAQIVSMFVFYVLGPPTVAASSARGEHQHAVDIQSLIPSAVQCDPDSVSDEECCICLGSLIEPDTPTDVAVQLGTRFEFVSSSPAELARVLPNSPTLGSLRPWIYHILHTHIAPDIDLDLDLDLDMGMLGEMLFPSTPSPAQTAPVQPQDRIMYTVCPMGKHPCHAACLQLYVQSQPTFPSHDAKVVLRCPTCRTPIPISCVPASPTSSEASEPVYSRSENTLQVMLTSMRARVKRWLTHTRQVLLAFLRHALRACLHSSRWADMTRAYGLNWPKRGLMRGLVASLCSLFVLVHFRVHARQKRGRVSAAAT